VFYTIRVPASSRRPNTPPSRGEPAPALPAAPRRVARRPKVSSRQAGLSVEAIVAAAIDALDESGLAGLSMRGVADRLGTGAASLYSYVSGREELLELIYDELVGRVALPDPDPDRWREQLHQMLRDLRDILIAHRDAALAGLGRVPTSPQTLRAAEALAAVLRAGGLSDYAIALGLDQLILYVSACAFEAGVYRHADMSAAEVDRYFQEVHTFYEALPPERFPVLASIAPQMTGHDADARFEFGVNLLIAGLERDPQPPAPVQLRG